MSGENTKGKCSELVRNTGVLAIGNFSSKILIFLLVPLYTNYLSTAEYGYYDLVYTTIQLLIPILTLNVTDGVLRFVIEDKKNIGIVNTVSFKYIFYGILASFFIVSVLAFTGISFITPVYAVILFLYYVFYLLYQYTIQFAKGVDRVKDMAIAGLIGTVVTVSLCLLFLMVLHYGLLSFFVANMCGYAVPALYLIVRTKPFSYSGSYEGDARVFEKKYLAYTVPLIFSNIGWWINNTSDRYIITWLKGVEVNGLLSVAYKLPSILNVIYGIFIQAWQITAMKEYGKEDSGKLFNSVFLYLNTFMFFAGSGLILVTKFLARFMFAKDFFPAWRFVPFLTLSTIFSAAAGYIAPILTSTYDTKSVAKSTLFGGIINIVLNILLTLMMGSQGVAIATAISSFCIMLYRYCALQKPRVIGKKVFIQSCIMWASLVVQATAMLYEIYWIQLVMIVLITVVCYKTVWEMIKGIFGALNSVRKRKMR